MTRVNRWWVGVKRFARLNRGRQHTLDKIRAQKGDVVEKYVVAGVMLFGCVFGCVLVIAFVFLASRPVSGSLSCHAKLDGNVQFDGREISTKGLYLWNGTLAKPEFVGGLPARSGMKVADFSEGRLNDVDVECAVSADWPAYMVWPIAFSEVFS